MMLLLIKLIPHDYGHLVTFGTKCQMVKIGSLNRSSELYFCFCYLELESEKLKSATSIYVHKDFDNINHFEV